MENQNLTEVTENLFGEVIYSYTRKQAIEDGELHEINELAQEAGFRFPVAITETVAKIVLKSCTGCRSWDGIIWDVLNCLKYSIRGEGAQTMFIVKVGRKDETFKAICSGGDNGEPVITIMLPSED